MVFNSQIFLFAFLPIVFTLFWLCRTKQQRYIILTISGYIFYGYWNWRFCFLLLFSSLVSYVAGLQIERAATPAVKRRWMFASIGIDLTLLGFFKYYDFLVGSLQSVLPGVPLPLLHVVLPIGISFYTFHTISYIADVAAERIRPTHNLWEYLAYVSLFSQLVAGPIVRFRQIEDDLENIDARPRDEYIARGVGFFVIGLVKKAVIADSIAQLIDTAIPYMGTASPMNAWMCALGFTFQLYYDFSGYSDMAVGLGYLFGIRIPQNFDSPYRATGIRDFWRRWHISLSTWLRDYLYIPLGGNRRGPRRTSINLFVTMLLGGLWHGANWTYVVWGAYHGGLLVAEHRYATQWERIPIPLRRAATFLLVTIGWVIFRSDSLIMAFQWLDAMTGLNIQRNETPIALIGWVLCCLIAVNTIPETQRFRFGAGRRWAILYAILFIIAYFFMNDRSSVFLYYQF